MRALVLDGAGFDHARVAEVAVPVPGPRQLLAAVDAAGVCTSLIKLIEQGAEHNLVYGWDIERYPLILGDEGAVTLVEVGAEMKGRYQAGQRFVIQPAVDHPPINHLERYRNHGRDIRKVAVGYTLPGQLAEYVLITEETLAAGCLLPLPEQRLCHAHVTLCEPFSCVISAQDHHVHLLRDAPGAPRRPLKGLLPGGVTVIIGAGAMGRMHVDLALSCGPAFIVVADRVDSRLERVRDLFAHRASQSGIGLVTVSVDRQELETAVADATGGRRADDVIVAAGSPEAIRLAQTLPAKGAVVNLFGGLTKSEQVVPLDSGLVHYGEILVTGSSGGGPWDMRRALELMSDGAIDPSVHITRIGALEHVPEFLNMIRSKDIDGKAIVYPRLAMDSILTVPRWTAEDERRRLTGGKG
jgi:threonine dehydrogenase-like Zn-dependent dehydrogenase